MSIRRRIVRLHPLHRKLRLLPIATLAACSLEPVQLPIVASIRPGTYALRLCRVVCDMGHPDNVIQAGFILLDTAPSRLERFSDSTRQWLKEMAMIAIDSGAANGCFVLESRSSVPTAAGGWGGGLVHWERVRATDWITFPLDRTSDSGHEDTVAFTSDGFAGRGGSWGMGIDYPTDLVAGQYLGPPDQRRCSEAAAAFAATMRKIARKMVRLPKPPESP